MGDVAKERGKAGVAARAGLGSESSNEAFAPGAKPRYETVIKVLQSLGVRLQVAA